MNQHSRRWYALAGLASVGAGAVMLVGALPGGAGAAVEGASTHVSPTEVPGNAKCPAGLTELKVGNGGPPVDGTFTDGTLEVTIDVRDTAEGQVFDWTSNIGVDVVIAKGGPNSNVYTYDPESTGDTGLHAPGVPSGMFAGLSHISFCYDEDQATTSTTAEETTSTTAEETTSTTAEETSTTAEETSTTAVSPSTTTPGGELPRTGSTVSPLLGIGAALLIGGGLLLAYARRFRSA
jgi:LPXTG-motif cell wall-anchored protein